MSRSAMILSTRLLAMACIAMGAGACNELERLDDGGPGGGPVVPDDVQRAFERSCNRPGCHDASAAGGLNLTATESPNIIGGSASGSPLPMVELGNVNGSYMAVKLLPEAPDGTTRTGVRMPQGADFNDPETAIDSAVILGWIAGAQLPGSDGGAATDGTDTMDSTGSQIVSCELSVIAPMATTPFDIGTEAGQIPPDVGAVLTANCGCHETDPAELIESVRIYSYSGMVHFSTIDEIRSDFMMAPAHERVLERVAATDPSRMPATYYCNLDGNGMVITDEDQQLLVDWLTAGAPDAVEWMAGG